MSSQTPVPATATTARDDPVRQGLVDPEIASRVLVLIRGALGRFPAGMTAAQRQSEPEELFQEVSKVALRTAQKFDPEQGSLVNWLGGIVWNVARQRKPSRYTSTEPSVLEATVCEARTKVLDDVESRIDAEQLLASLPPADAQLLKLHAEGLTAVEIGESLKLTAGNVRVRLSRILKRMRSLHQQPKTGGEL